MISYFDFFIADHLLWWGKEIYEIFWNIGMWQQTSRQTAVRNVGMWQQTSRQTAISMALL